VDGYEDKPLYLLALSRQLLGYQLGPLGEPPHIVAVGHSLDFN
jgi:hypothetical protein